MIVSIDDIKKAFKGESKAMQALKKQHKLLRMHIYGIGLTDYLTQISGLENTNQIALRKKYARSNKNLFSSLLNPINKVFSAKGKNKTYDVGTEKTQLEFRDILSTISNGKSLENWLNSYWKEKIAADPNGLFLIEKDSEGNPYPTYKSILSIRDYKQTGQKVEYIIFEPQTRQGVNGLEETVRVYDDESDSLYLKREDTFILLEDESFVNTIEEVPAVIISTIEDTNSEFKRSAIYNEIELADEYLLDTSVKRIYKFAHGYPLFWMYLSRCPACNGTKQIKGQDCTSCKGTGYSVKKDVSDIIGVKPPERPEDVTITPDIAGYISPPTESLTQMTDELELLTNSITFSQWGTTSEKGENETATGRFIDIQPVSDKLESYTDSLEIIEGLLVDFIGMIIYQDAYKGNSINYGRRYMIETPDQLLNKYTEGKTKNLSPPTLDYLLEQYYQGQFASSFKLLTYYQKLAKLEPWVHMTVNEVPVSYQTTIDYQKKIYFSDWKNQIKIEDVVKTELKKLDKQLTNFTKEKQKNGTQPE